jgi:hypothetical protein
MGRFLKYRITNIYFVRRKKRKSGDLWPNMKGTAKYSASQKGALYFRRDN